MFHFHRTRLLLALVLLSSVGMFSSTLAPSAALAANPTLPHPILFVTHVPTAFDVITTVSTFNNHTGDVHAAGRGGDLWLRYSDGTLKNLTALAGYGVASGLQDTNAIAVRDPSVSWDGTKALFSMVIGAPSQGTTSPPNYFWQIYEVTNLGQVIQNPATTPIIQKVANQPAGYNNITPIYGTNGRIIFTSDRPRNGQAHLYPMLDEYNMRPTNTGLWSMDPATGDLFQMDSSPSGDFSPSIDSYGRVIFMRWDHLERDQQTDADALALIANPSSQCKWCTFNYSDETAQATKLATNAEYFPEPRPQRTDLLPALNSAGHHMNEFLPWQIREDGKDPETINHVGRHELLAHIPAAFTNDPNLTTLNGAPVGAANQSRIGTFLQIREDPSTPGTYYGTNVLELTHASGQLIKMTGAPSLNGDQMVITYVTHPETMSTSNALTLPNSDGHYRDPLPLTNGTLVAAYTTNKHFESPLPGNPTGISAFDFRLYLMGTDPINAQYLAHDGTKLLTSGLPTKTLSYYDKTLFVSRTNLQLWELQPVEVYARTLPPTVNPIALAPPEQNAFTAAGITPAQLQQFMTQNGLALIVSRNVTSRDHSDVQQPLRLQVGTNGVITAPGSGKLYRIDFLQLLQADQLRSAAGNGTASFPALSGRRVLAQPLHDQTATQFNPAVNGAPAGSVALGSDGSMAAFVPARRAMTWQLTDNLGNPVVRERFWLTMQPGEIRVCAACHGLNQTDQAGNTLPINTPQALTTLLQNWKQLAATLPTITGLNPSEALVGGASFTLTVTGTNFTNSSVVYWNGVSRTTTFVNSTTLTAQITAADIANAGSTNVTVSNPSTGTISSASTFVVSTNLYPVYVPVVKR